MKNIESFLKKQLM